jgi:pimeloyl-ACP methyl ester carboxylesterase
MLKYHDFNNANGKPIINLAVANGFPAETYTRALQPLMANYHVVSLHARPLWGDADPADLKRWTQLSDDLLNQLDELTDQPVIGIGHSVGGVATIHAAIKRPEKFSRLILIEPTMLSPFLLFPLWLIRSVGRTPRFGLIDGALRRRDTWANVEEAFEYFKEKRLFARWPQDVLRAYAESITAPAGDGTLTLSWPREWEAQIYRTMPTDVWPLPRKIKQPFLLMHGELSDTFGPMSARVFRLLRPDTRMITIKGAGHLVPQEKPDEVGKVIAEYLGK